ncbi:MAG: hypothetical protein DCC53_16900 [Chloroflexi bacterium]|nr:hypothetical protein [Anaerolineae bacterium]RIK18205.1 MAG: hypothetical protein DCC53_16900 [Chloroflexota bacterium]
MAKKSIDAVYDDDLLELLDNLGLKSKFENGILKCAFCNDVIDWKNLHSIFPHGGQVKFSCSKPACVKSLVEKLQDTR